MKSSQHHLHSLDNSATVSEAFTLPSCQFSDACFSLDISNPTPVQTQNEWILQDTNHINEKLQLLKRQSFSFGVKDLNLGPSTGIHTPVWDELEHQNENRKSANQAKEQENMNLRRPFWSKLLMCR